MQKESSRRRRVRRNCVCVTACVSKVAAGEYCPGDDTRQGNIPFLYPKNALA